ncbi:MAG: hypothetical protein PQJ58_22285 [Spirochaetales bacterium]|nr:hypothetical protein [Spirochaetales bacterium]
MNEPLKRDAFILICIFIVLPPLTARDHFVTRRLDNDFFETRGSQEIQDNLITVEFLCEARLSPLLNLFMSIGVNNRNIGFYINGLLSNLKRKMES